MKKVALFSIIILLLLSGLFAHDKTKFNDGKLHVVFCNVGQGDAILITTASRKHVLIDGGPDRSVLNCMAKHMPFWERKIDLMVLTHPHADHFMGMYYVLDRYDVTAFATEKLENKSGSFQELMKLLDQHGVPVRHVIAGDRWKLGSTSTTGDVVLSVLGPSLEFLDRTSPNGSIGDSKEFASLISRLDFGSFHILFTGDTQTGELGSIVNVFDREDNPIDILQSPHHGSRTGLNADIVQKIDPRLVVISVGAKNRYKHPSQQTLDILEAAKIPILRTDKVGDIEIVSDGKSFNVKK